MEVVFVDGIGWFAFPSPQNASWGWIDKFHMVKRGLPNQSTLACHNLRLKDCCSTSTKPLTGHISRMVCDVSALFNGGCQAAGFAPYMSRTWKNGWLFESFVGMATRHLHNSKSLGQVCMKQVLSRCLFHQTLTGIWWNYILLTETSVGGRRGLVSDHVKINLFDCQIRISIYHRLQDNNSLVWNGKPLCTTEDYHDPGLLDSFLCLAFPCFLLLMLSMIHAAYGIAKAFHVEAEADTKAAPEALVNRDLLQYGRNPTSEFQQMSRCIQNYWALYYHMFL